MTLMELESDSSKLMLIWTFENDFDRFSKKSAELYTRLIGYTGTGSLLECLKKLDYAIEISCNLSTDICTPFRCIKFELELTQTGIQNIQKLLSFIFEYLSIVRDEWFAEPDTICFFQEMKTMSSLNYQMYRVPDPASYTSALSQAMIFTQDMSRVLQDVYEDAVFAEVDLEDCKRFATECSYERCKVIFAGKGLLSAGKITADQAEIKVEKWFSSKYTTCKKPENLHELFMSLFLDNAWYSAVRNIEQPRPNRFVPQDTTSIVHVTKRKSKNDAPEEIKF